MLDWDALLFWGAYQVDSLPAVPTTGNFRSLTFRIERICDFEKIVFSTALDQQIPA